MGKHTTKEAYFERLKTLADVNKASIKESKIHNLGSLIDYKRAADGVAYGIVKENHHYYIKKAGTKKDPNIADFTYIGGLENITGFQYKSLAEADKQRNMLFHTINEAISFKPNKTGSKMVLREDVAQDEIEQAQEKLDDLDTATDAEKTSMEVPEPEGSIEMDAGLSAEPTDNVETPEGGEEVPDMGGEALPDAGAEETPDMGGEALPDAGTEETPEGGEETPDMGAEETPDVDSEETPEGSEEDEEGLSEIQSKVAKMASEIKDSKLDGPELTWLLKTFVRGFIPNEDEANNPNANKMSKIDDDDRHEISDMILKIVSPEDVQSLEQNVEDTEAAAEIAEGQQCSECGNFATYAESMGYGSAEALKECGEEEVGNLISNYANHHADGMNDGDHEGVALIIKIVNPEILDKLKGDYGHEEYAEKVAPFVDQVNENSEEEMIAKFNEGFGAGIAGLGKAALKGVGNVAKKGLGKVISGTGQAIQKGAQAIGQTAQKAGQIYQAASKAGDIKSGQKTMSKSQGKIDALANKLTNDVAKEINNLKAGAVKAGEQIDVNQVLDQVLAKIKQGYTSAAITSGAVQEQNVDVANTQTKPNIGFAPDSQNLGIAKISESEEKLRKYIRARLEEHAGIRKPMLNESKKSDALKKLDKMIDREYNLNKKTIQESIKKKSSVNELDTATILSAKKKAYMDATNPNLDPKQLEKRKRQAAEFGHRYHEITDPEDDNIQVAKPPVKQPSSVVAENSKKPSAGLSKEKKSDVVKAAKKGEDIGKSGKGFKEVAKKAAKEYGSKEKGEKVAAAAMWKNIKREGVEEKPVMSEAEQKLRKYIRARLEEHAGIRKPMLNESKKSDNLKRLDAIIDKQFKLHESNNMNELFGIGGGDIKTKFASLDPNNAPEVEKLFQQAFKNILMNPQMGAIGRAAKTTPVNVKYDLLKQYIDSNGGTLRTSPDGRNLVFASQAVKNAATANQFASGGTGGKTSAGGV